MIGSKQSKEHPSGGLPETPIFKFLYGTVLNVMTLIICLLGANLFSMAVSFIFMVSDQKI